MTPQVLRKLNQQLSRAKRYPTRPGVHMMGKAARTQSQAAPFQSIIRPLSLSILLRLRLQPRLHCAPLKTIPWSTSRKQPPQSPPGFMQSTSDLRATLQTSLPMPMQEPRFKRRSKCYSKAAAAAWPCRAGRVTAHSLACRIRLPHRNSAEAPRLQCADWPQSALHPAMACQLSVCLRQEGLADLLPVDKFVLAIEATVKSICCLLCLASVRDTRKSIKKPADFDAVQPST